MDFESIQAFLHKADIPKIKRQPKTFMGIAGQPHYENVLSNMYSFYFDAKEEHGLGDLFILTLIQMVQETEVGKQKNFAFANDLSNETEFPTKKGGRIDLLLTDDLHSIIIENKVYHTLNNDLEDYWNSAKGAVENKIGIVLSLFPINSTGHHHFINITHPVFLKRVIANSGNYLLEANDKYMVFLKDLVQNIINMSTSIMNKADLEFYFGNQKQINEIASFKHRVKTHILSEVEKVPAQLDEKFGLVLSGKRSDRLRYYISSVNSNLMITVIVEGLLLSENKKMHIVVELAKSALKNKEIYKTINFSQEEVSANVFVPDFYTNNSNAWAHFATKAYHPNEQEIAHLSQFIIDKLQKDHFLSIYQKLNQLFANRNSNNV